ncbi:MAG: nucleotidyl transferase AbiEii/AbiGii toxin family protein [Geminicoccales bacterium]
MAFAQTYRAQVELLIRTLPHVAAEDCFAMKGGTAINFFVRDLPRLSVDIDLTYLPIQPREVSLVEIEAALTRTAGRLSSSLPGAHIQAPRADNLLTKLIVRNQGVQIKVEVTPVLRGCVFEPEIRSVAPIAERIFGFAEMRIVSLPDLYAGKIVAALDRQHPRDLFDVRELLANKAIDNRLRQAFIVYLLSHGRPMAEVLNSPQKDIAQEFARGFVGMTADPVDLEELIKAREELVAQIVSNMPEDHREFLISFEEGEPDWALLGVDLVPDLPAVRWRQQNLDKLSDEDRGKLVAQLEAVLIDR